MANKILVLGATGNVGRPLVKELQAQDVAVVAASRSGKSVEGAEGVVFDYLNPETFDAAFAGVDSAYVMLPAGYVDQKELLTAVIDVATKHKVKVVLQSAFGVDADDEIPYRQVEIALENSGIPYVILRPNWFSDNFHTFWKAGVDHGQIQVPAEEGKSSFIDVRDIAASAAAALTTDEFDNQAFNLTGPEAFSYAEAAVLIGDAIGQPVSYQNIADEDFIKMLSSVGVPEDYAGFVASIFYPVREGWTATVTTDAETLTGNKPRSLQQYIADNLGALQAQ